MTGKARTFEGTTHTCGSKTRYVVGGACVSCRQTYARAYIHRRYASDPVSIKARSIAWKNKDRAANPAKYKARWISEYSNDPEGHRDRIYAARAANRGKYNSHAAARRAIKLKRTPVWTIPWMSKLIYEGCPAGNDVDHIIPLQGEFVSGLHVPWNLQYLPSKENVLKGNKWAM